MTTEETEKPAKRKKAAKADAPSILTLRYELAELTSSQHRAGLAGIVLMAKWMERAAEKRGVFRVAALDAHGATVEVDAEGMAWLFDELYAATEEENAENAQRKDKKTGAPVAPIRTEERVTRDDKTGKEKKKTVYLYPVTVPSARMLVDLEPEKNPQGPWVKLWRNMVWTILRGVPATREPFEARAEGRPTTDAAAAWAQLADPADPVIELPSTYYLGAMARTAENVGFFDRARRQFLLHFWPYAAQVYVPQTVNVMDATSEFHGFAIAIPDVAELDTFCDDYVRVLQQRTKELDRYRPKGAVVELAQEAALDLARQLRDVVAAREGRRATGDLVLGFDVIHVNKEGNNVRVYANLRVTPDERLLREYERVRRAGYYDALFRRQLLRNVIDGRRWYDGFDAWFETTPYKKQTIGRWQFCRDCTVKFRERSEEMTTRGEEPVGEKNLDVLVREMITAYVMRKADAKSGTSWDKAKDVPRLKKEWEDQKERAARDAFLAVRSRTGADFVDYFVGTLCSQGQFLPPKRYDTIAAALREKRDDVRTLTMLALSAQAWVSTTEKKNEE